jgi:CheY-like chemotaxis protein
MRVKPMALILHDQPQVVRTLDYLLRTTGVLRPCMGIDIEQACEQIRHHRVALVMLETCRLDPVQAAQACASLRQAWGHEHADDSGPGQSVNSPRRQIWFITSRASSVDLEDARELGADRILTMPFDPDLVQQLVWELGRQWNGPLAKAS